MIIARFLPFFPNSPFLIKKSCSKSTAKKQGKIWCLVAWWGWLGVLLAQVVLGSFWVVLDGFCWVRVTSDGLRWFAVLLVTSISQRTEHLTCYYIHGRT